MSVYAQGETAVTEYWQAYDPATGLPSTAAVAHNQTGLTLAYTPERESRVVAVVGGATEPVSLAADNAAHTPWGWRHVGGGLHRVDWPDAAQPANKRTVVKQVMVVSGTVAFLPAPVTSLTTANPRIKETKEGIADAAVRLAARVEEAADGSTTTIPFNSGTEVWARTPSSVTSRTRQLTPP